MGFTTVPAPISGDVITSAWGGLVGSLHNGIQSGIATVVISAANSATVAITFGRPYAGQPVIVCSVLLASASGWIATVESWTTAGAVLRVTARDAGSFTANVPVGWIAIGTAA